jgi:superfamily II DNA or RNA helicase
MNGPLELRQWQSTALEIWRANNRGIVEVVTGGGKTVFALACVRAIRPLTTLVVVPTTALLDQWWEEVASFFSLRVDEIHVLGKARRLRAGTINLAVLNTASALPQTTNQPPCFLIVDECHRAASPAFRSVLELKSIASVGLSATPERPYDDGLQEVLVPALGPIIFRYTYREAKRDGVIVPFVLHNIVFELEPEVAAKYDKLTKGIAKSISTYGFEAPETIALLLRRSRVLNMSKARIRVAMKLIAENRGEKIVVFHEDIGACNVMGSVLKDCGVRAGIYHSRMSTRERALMLHAFRGGELDVLVTCRALDEGFNVPETTVGIIAAATATRRQRIQRLGRVLRPGPGKSCATVYTIVASGPEITRLKEEEQELEGVAEVKWSAT